MKISVGQFKTLVREAAQEPDEKDMMISVYSDVYKEKFGVRPRWFMERLNAMTIDQIQAELDKLYDTPDMDDDYDFEPTPEYPDMEGTVNPTEPPTPFEELGDMPTKIPFKGGDEYDALGPNPGIHTSLGRPGARKAAKTSYNRRLRRGG